MTLKVGLIVGMEWSFPPAFIEEVNGRNEGVIAEYVKLGAPAMDDPAEYAVIIDRISHEVPFYRTYLKQAALRGCTVINNPFMWTADDKFFGAALATSLGIAHPKTVVLPNKEYIPGIDHDKSLRNLKYPLDWQGIVDYVGMPCILKDAHGGGWKEVYVCRSMEELIHHYDHSGMLTMVAQEFIEWEHFIRCIVVGQEQVMPIKYDPRERKYHVEHEYLTPELGRRVVDDSLKLCRALGYDMNSMEWAVRDGVPYAIDFMNPAPDMDVNSLTPHYFDWVVKAMADMVIRLAKNPRPQAADLRWSGFFTHSRETGEGPTTGYVHEPEADEAGAVAEAFDADGGTVGSHGRGAGHGDAGLDPEAASTSTPDPAPGGTGDERNPGLLSGGRDGGAAGGGETGNQTRNTGGSPGAGTWPQEGGGSWSPAGGVSPGHDSSDFADAASAPSPEPALGETASKGGGVTSGGKAGDEGRTGEDTTAEEASSSTEETA